MLVQPIQETPRSAHVVVLASEKGGSGKSTTALHIAVALLKAGQRVATIDLDGRQKSFTHYIENRRAWAERGRIQLELPTHYCIDRAESSSVEANESKEVANFSTAISAIEHSHNVVVVDTPGHDTFLMRLAHSMADS
jgi:chromosome partitioning protein